MMNFFLALKQDTASDHAYSAKPNKNFAKNWERALGSIALSTLGGGFIFEAMTFVVPRYFETNLMGILTSVPVTGALAALVYATASFSQIAIGRLNDIYSPNKYNF